MINSVFGFGTPAIDYMIIESQTNAEGAVRRFESAAAAGALPTTQTDFDSLLGIDYDNLTSEDKKKLIKKIEGIYRSNGCNVKLNG